MVVPDWFIKLLEMLGLKKREKSNEDLLQDLYDKREKAYKTLGEIESEIKELTKQLQVTEDDKGNKIVSFSETDIEMAKSNVGILRKKFDNKAKLVALFNSNILQLELIIYGEEIDIASTAMEEKIYALNESIAILERAANIKKAVDIIIAKSDDIKINDPTVEVSCTAEINASNNGYVNIKNIKSESENTNITV